MDTPVKVPLKGRAADDFVLEDEGAQDGLTIDLTDKLINSGSKKGTLKRNSPGVGDSNSTLAQSMLEDEDDNDEDFEEDTQGTGTHIYPNSNMNKTQSSVLASVRL